MKSPADGASPDGASPDGVFMVLCTVPVEEANALADRLLDERLVACVNFVGPLTSRYRWQGRIEQGSEMLLLMKSTETARRRLRERIAELHSYSQPEVLEFAAAGGLADYLGWVRANCVGGQD